MNEFALLLVFVVLGVTVLVIYGLRARKEAEAAKAKEAILNAAIAARKPRKGPPAYIIVPDEKSAEVFRVLASSATEVIVSPYMEEGRVYIIQDREALPDFSRRSLSLIDGEESISLRMSPSAAPYRITTV